MKSLSLKVIVILFSIIFYSCESDSTLDELSIDEESSSVGFLDNNGDPLDGGEDPIDGGGGPIGGGGPTGGGTTTSLRLSNRFQYFHRGRTSNAIFSSNSTTGLGNWSNSRNVGIGEIKEGAISSAQFGNRLVVANRGNNSSTKIFYATSSNGNSFGSAREVNNGARTKGAMRIIEFNNNLFMYHTGFTGSNTNRLFYSFSSNLINWGGNQRISDNGNQLNSFDVIENNDVMYLVGGRSVGNSIVVQSSTNGINFQQVSSTALSGFDRPTVSVTKIGNTFYLLIGRRVGNNEIDLYISQSSNNFRTISTPRAIIVNGSIARSDELPSIAANDNRLVIAFQEFFGNRTFFAYSDNRGTTWAGNRAATGETKNSSIDLIYTRSQ